MCGDNVTELLLQPKQSRENKIGERERKRERKRKTLSDKIQRKFGGGDDDVVVDNECFVTVHKSTKKNTVKREKRKRKEAAGCYDRL